MTMNAPDIITLAQRTLAIEQEALGECAARIDAQFVKAVQLCLACTGRIVVTGDACERNSFMRNLASNIAELAFDYLDAPPARVHQKDVPLPYAANLEALSLPSVEDIVKAAKAVAYK